MRHGRRPVCTASTKRYPRASAESSPAAVASFTELGHTLGLKVVAEGVETPQHLQRAREACCDAVQGFFLSKPLEERRFGSSCRRGRRRGWGSLRRPPQALLAGPDRPCGFRAGSGRIDPG